MLRHMKRGWFDVLSESESPSFRDALGDIHCPWNAAVGDADVVVIVECMCGGVATGVRELGESAKDAAVRVWEERHELARWSATSGDLCSDRE